MSQAFEHGAPADAMHEWWGPLRHGRVSWSCLVSSNPGGEVVVVLTYRFADWTFEPASGDLTHPDEGAARLQPQPARLLELLLEHDGAVVSRDEIVATVWPDTRVEFDQAVNFAIRQIRQALGDSASDPQYIETLHRRGYRIIVPVSRVGPPPSSGDPAAALALDDEAAGISAADEAAALAAAAGSAAAVPGDEEAAGILTYEEAPRTPATEEAAALAAAAGAVSDPSEASAKPSRWHARRAVRVALIATVGIGGWWAGTRPEPAPPAPIVAVQVPRHDGTSAATGAAVRLAESLTASLTRRSGDRLRVLGPASTEAFGSGRDGPARMREELGADYVLGGNVSEAAVEGVFLELIDTRDGSHLWAMRFDPGDSAAAAAAADSVFLHLTDTIGGP